MSTQTMIALSEETKELRKFAFIVGSVLMLMAWWSPKLKVHAGLIVAVSLLLMGLSLLTPNWVRPLYHMWSKIGHVCGAINQKVLLVLIFFLLVVPIGLVLRLIRSKSMPKGFDPKLKTYRVASVIQASQRMEVPYL